MRALQVQNPTSPHLRTHRASLLRSLFTVGVLCKFFNFDTIMPQPSGVSQGFVENEVQGLGKGRGGKEGGGGEEREGERRGKEGGGRGQRKMGEVVVAYYTIQYVHMATFIILECSVWPLTTKYR